MNRILGFLLAVLLSASAIASAQTEEDLARARTQFAEGVQLLEQENWPEAADRFRAVLEVRATSQVKYNLAIALEHMGEIAEAARLLAEVIQDREFDRRIRRQARTLLEQIVPRLGRLTIQLGGDEAGGATILLDGEDIGLDRVGRAIPVSPGDHRVELRRGGRSVATRTVSLAEGQEEEITLVDPSVGAVGVVPLDDELLRTRERQREAGGGDVTGEWWFWTAIGAAVLVVAGVIIGVAVGTSGGQANAIQGDLMPGTIEVMLP